MLNRFEARDWVVRRPDPTDGRYTLATLTDSGRHKVVATAPSHVALVQQLVFDPLSAAQRRNISTALTRIAATVRRELDGK